MAMKSYTNFIFRSIAELGSAHWAESDYNLSIGQWTSLAALHGGKGKKHNCGF